MSYDALTVIVWILRIVLPCVLFWISFGTKLRLPWNKAEAAENFISRDTMLLHHKAVSKAGLPAPEALANIQLVDQQSAPSLFQDRRSRDRGEGGNRERAGRGRREDREDRPRGDKDQRRERRRQPTPPPPEEEEEEEQVTDASEEKMHLESLVNFVAFSKREQQRVFLPDAESAPPPPPPKPTAKPTSALNEKGAGASAAAPQANSEAQMVLRGAMKAGSRGAAVARSLHTQLTDNGIDISPVTFELMVEASVQATELQCASDFLMRMEAAGHTPSNELLDRVMELYLQRKRDGATKGETEALEASKFAPGAGIAPDDPGVGSYVGTDDAMSLMVSMAMPETDPAAVASRSKLCASAAPFVPGGDASGDGTGMPLTASAPLFTPMGMGTAERTRLSATAMPFVPGGNDENPAQEEVEEETNGKREKGKGRGGKDGKAKAKAKQPQRVYREKKAAS